MGLSSVSFATGFRIWIALEEKNSGINLRGEAAAWKEQKKKGQVFMFAFTFLYLWKMNTNKKAINRRKNPTET